MKLVIRDLSDCAEIHEQYDRYANAGIQVGEFPPWMRVSGKVAWYVYQGLYSRLPDAWADFMRKLQTEKPGPFAGPPGDVYVCDPDDHEADEQRELITILWTPLRE
jgi:hypothetical protein